MGYAVRSDNMGWRAVDSVEDCEVGENFYLELPQLPVSLSRIEEIIDARIDLYVDSVAAAKKYKRVGVTPSDSCVGYAGFTNQYQPEGVAFGQWMTANWNLAFAYRAQVEAEITAGTRQYPSTEQDINLLADEFIAYLQANNPMVWPA